jgi:hypothetical protein
MFVTLLNSRCLGSPAPPRPDRCVYESYGEDTRNQGFRQTCGVREPQGNCEEIKLGVKHSSHLPIESDNRVTFDTERVNIPVPWEKPVFHFLVGHVNEPA